MGYYCQIYGVNSNFDSVFNCFINMPEGYLIHPHVAPKIAVNDTSITVIYTMAKNDLPYTYTQYLLQLSLATADTNWIKSREDYGSFYNKSQIEITNSAIFLVGNGIEKYSLTGDSISFNRNQQINQIIIDTNAGKIYGYPIYVQNDINIYTYDLNLNLTNTIYPIYTTGYDKRLISVALIDSLFVTCGITMDANNNNKLVSLDVDKIDLNGNLFQSCKLNVESYIIDGFARDKPLIDRNQDLIAITTVKLKPIKDSNNNTLNAMPIFACKFSFDSSYNISGTVFVDENTNCEIESNETGIEYNLMHLLPEDIYTYTDSTGFYSFKKENGPANIEYVPYINGFNNCVANGTQAISVINSSIVDSVDFGMQVISPSYDARCALYVSTSRPGFIQSSNVLIQNISTNKIHNVQAALFIDTAYIFQSASIMPDSIVGHTAFWNFDSMSIGKIKNIYINVMPSLSVFIGYEYKYVLQISADGDTVYTANNIDSISGITIGSFDPNHKIATPAGIGAEGYIENNTDLNYYIEFQNTGTDTAFNVKLTDELDQYLDLSSLTIQGSSHPMHYTLKNRILTFYLNNILLPDSNKDYQKSIGYVAYNIKPKANILGKKIKNKASIFFDYNAPIITNTTLHTIGVPSNFLQLVEDDIFAYPIPLYEKELIININLVSTGKTTLEIYDASGRKIYTIINGNLEKGVYQYKLDNSIFNSKQLYFISLKTQNSKKSIKFFKN